MATSGPLYPGTAISALVGGENAETWLNPANIGADDGAEAAITADTFDSPDVSYLLVGYNFGFAIPASATIDGMTVEIQRRAGAGGAQDNRVQVWVIADGPYGTNKFSAAAWPATPTTAVYGGPTDTWGAPLTPAFVNSPNFGIGFSAQATAPDTDVQVDFIRVTIDYTDAGGSERRAIMTWSEFQVPDVSAVPPVAAFTHVATGRSVAFTDTSTDSDGTVVGWSWNFGDGTSPSTEQNPTHLYQEGGTYQVTLTVTDSQTLTDEVTNPVEAILTIDVGLSAVAVGVPSLSQVKLNEPSTGRPLKKPKKGRRKG